ncbi:MAG: hypothetical protein HUU06_13515, partial [Planctomycetaceae bacterium]|nr:hypothetical protein [Planctomycetaceae bacterium]
LRGAGDALEPVIDARNIRGGIRPLDVRNLDVAEARARYEGGRVVVSDVLGAMGDREFTVREARFDLDAGTGSMDMEVRRLRFPRDLLGVLSEEAVAGIERVTPDRFFHVDRLDVTLSDGFRGIALDGVVSLSPTRAGRSDGLGVQGVFDLEGLAFRRGAEGDPATVITGAVLVRGGEFRPGVAVDSLDARIDFGGTFGPEGNRAVLTVSEAKGRVEERVLEGGSAIVEVNADGILLRELRGRVAKGEIGGWMQFPPGGGYEGRFSLSGAHAPDLFAPADPKAGVEGRISANARLRNRTGKPDDLGGNLRVDITEGALFRVPLFDSIYGILGLTEPPVFTGGTFDADLNGDRMRISRVDLESSVLGLHKSAGGSFLWLDGRIDLRLTPEFRGILETWPLRWIKDLISLPIKPVVERIHAIHVTGTLQRPVVNQDWLTFLSSRPEDRPRLPAPPREVDVPRRPPIDF